MSLHATLAKLAADPEKRKKSYDSDWFAPNQKGTAVITNIVTVDKDATVNVFLEAKILASRATTQGFEPQPVGTKVKKMYRLSAVKWAKEELMNDLLNIAGLTGNEGDAVNDYLASALGEKCGIIGVAFDFSTKLQTQNRSGKVYEKPLTIVSFSESKLNEEAQVEARKKEILG